MYGTAFFLFLVWRIIFQFFGLCYVLWKACPVTTVVIRSYIIWGSKSDVAKDSGLLGCDTVSFMLNMKAVLPFEMAGTIHLMTQGCILEYLKKLRGETELALICHVFYLYSWQYPLLYCMNFSFFPTIYSYILSEPSRFDWKRNCKAKSWYSVLFCTVFFQM